MMWKILYKSSFKNQAWAVYEAFDNKYLALMNACLVASKFTETCVMDPSRRVIWKQ